MISSIVASPRSQVPIGVFAISTSLARPTVKGRAESFQIEGAAA